MVGAYVWQFAGEEDLLGSAASKWGESAIRVVRERRREVDDVESIRASTGNEVGLFEISLQLLWHWRDGGLGAY